MRRLYTQLERLTKTDGAVLIHGESGAGKSEAARALHESSPLQHGPLVELDLRDSRACRAFARELRTLAREHSHTEAIKVFFFHPKFPVDVRHNAKIHRLTLAKWAATAKGYESDPKR